MSIPMAIVTLSASFEIGATCHVRGTPVEQGDILHKLLKSSVACPLDVAQLKEEFMSDGLVTLPAMVANRGRNNPRRGSFSIFESVQGFSAGLSRTILPEHLYFGHFTALGERNEIILDQKNHPNKLLIEVIAYDFKKEVFNFYELIGSQSGPQWFYRGDSYDAIADNKDLKISSSPVFGKRMRCSACHNSGGPIMKELAPPHNDWWTKARGLVFVPHRPSPHLKEYLSGFIDASRFSKHVIRGMNLLAKKNILEARTLKERLRPLFCATELNLRSDNIELDSPSVIMKIPSEIFVNPLLVLGKNLELRKDYYEMALKTVRSQFPETSQLDADHGFLAPVRSWTDQSQVVELITEGVIDQEFAFDVLSIDFKNPLFSDRRCELLKFIPESKNWLTGFKGRLSKVNTPTTEELLKNLQLNNGAGHQERARNFLIDKENSWRDQSEVVKEINRLQLLRQSVFKDSISQNPLGQILEPGFRIIFPEHRP